MNYYYDALDRLTSKVTPEGTLRYTYYASGKVESITSSNANGTSVSYTYDAGVPVDRSSSTGWDDLNRLSTVVDGHLQGNQTTTYSYDTASNVAEVTYPNNLTSKFTYDALNRLTALFTSTSPVSSYNYTLGATGNRTAATEGNGRSLAWNYDDIYRLTSETISGDPSQNNGSVAYGLDPVGNRTSAISTFSSLAPGYGSYNADDQLSGESYDANGNTTRTANGSQYTYDSENHLIKMVNGSTVVTLQYDAFGNRVAKTVNGVTTKYLVEDDVNPTGLPQVVEELVNGAVTRQYTYGLQRISENQEIANVWTSSFYEYDGGGSVRQLTNSAGAVTDEYEYDAFGNSFTKVGTTPNNYLYRGEQYDSDLGLYYLRARYYNPATARFLSRDRLAGRAQSPMTLHKYLYTGGDPVNRIDPRGLEIEGVALTTISSLQKTVAFGNFVSCGANIGLTAATGSIFKSLQDDIDHPGGTTLGGLGVTSTAIGCITMFTIPETGSVTVSATDILGLAGCGLSVVQDVYDLNRYWKEPTEENSLTFESDWTAGMIGCIPTLISTMI